MRLSPRYIDPFKVLKRIGKVAYELELPLEMSAIHNVFHVYTLNKCVADPTQVLESQTIGAQANLSYEDKPVQILDQQIKELRNKEIALVKVLWRNHRVEEATWETEEDMRKKYPELF